jgi:hypothetical protein
VRALESLDSTMYFDMFIEVGSLGKAKSTIRERTAVRSFVCVDSEVIKEVVPFSEMFTAIFVITFQNLDIPLWLRILESEDTELLSGWDVLLYLNWLKIEGLTSLDEHWNIIWDVFECIAVFYILNFDLIFSFLRFKWLSFLTYVIWRFILTHTQSRFGWGTIEKGVRITKGRRAHLCAAVGDNWLYYLFVGCLLGEASNSL